MSIELNVPYEVGGLRLQKTAHRWPFSNLAHGQPPVGQRAPPRKPGGSHGWRVVPRRSAPMTGGRYRPASVIEFRRNQ